MRVILRREVFHMLQQSARNPGFLVSMTATVLLLGACSAQSPQNPPRSSEAARAPASRPADSLRERAAAIAMQQVGAPYRYGGVSTAGFDCSGLVHYSYSRAGKHVPRTTAGLWQTTLPVTSRELQAGDVLFFRIEGKMSHVGMYLGDGQFVHAPSSGREVSIENLDSDFYSRAFIRGGRP